MAKVCIVLTTGGSVMHPIIGVYSIECKAQAEEHAKSYLNESAGNNVYSGRSIGPRSQFCTAWVETHEVKES
jgi:hypothetical protein